MTWWSMRTFISTPNQKSGADCRVLKTSKPRKSEKTREIAERAFSWPGSVKSCTLSSINRGLYSWGNNFWMCPNRAAMWTSWLVVLLKLGKESMETHLKLCLHYSQWSMFSVGSAAANVKFKDNNCNQERRTAMQKTMATLVCIGILLTWQMLIVTQLRLTLQRSYVENS